jgi:hypothetical protein|eukprot:3599784-Prymnesium_polylepis.1
MGFEHPSTDKHVQKTPVRIPAEIRRVRRFAHRTKSTAPIRASTLPRLSSMKIETMQSVSFLCRSTNCEEFKEGRTEGFIIYRVGVEFVSEGASNW